MYPHPLEIEGFLGKVESAYGVDAAPVAGTDGIRTSGRLWAGITPEWAFPNLNEDLLNNSLVPAEPGTPAGRIVSLEIAMQLRGAGIAYSSTTPVRPESDAVLVACGMSRTHDDTASSETVTYTMVDSGYGSSTFYVYAGAKLFRISGTRGVWTWEPLAGELGLLRARMQGLLLTDPTEIEPPAITYDSVVVPPNVAMGLAIVPDGGSPWGPRTRNVTVTPGQNIVRLDDISAADGIEGFFYRGRSSPLFTMTPRTQDLTTYDPWDHRNDARSHQIDMQLNPNTQYNRVFLAIQEAYLNTPGNADDQGFAANNLEYRCHDMSLFFS